ncbi:methyltransferase domain-containing protein [Lacibacter sediminis]|uniref:Methyltransferase domain-containing protein n=1 Tax=Lacibacter sediminis TaxID=2760713 RepID=A0A7G5XBK8_9BACT|nr:methyltransferase domain-containing protein [Lacibacter sediminis]QNA42861.1 methyltransferase domain-containing protein [Lacibacter sediminis]
MSQTTLNAEYWSNRYQQQQTGWDIGYGSTPLVEYLQSLKDKSISILIPGCGNAYEAEWLLQHGFTDITVLDISPVLTAALAERFKGQPINIITGDFFEHNGQYDLILEQTFFCALDPTLRSRYVEHMHQLLKPGGELVGVLFNKEFEGGPPFGGSKAEYEELFSKHLHIKKMELCYNSILPRRGAELFFSADGKV